MADGEEGAEIDVTANAMLSPPEVEVARRHGTELSVSPGEVVLTESDEEAVLLLIIDGEVELYRSEPISGEEVYIAFGETGSLLGEFNVLTGQKSLFHARARDNATIVRLASDDLRQLMAAEPEVGDRIFAILVARRELLNNSEFSDLIRIVGSRFAKATLDLIGYARRMRIGHSWIDPDDDPSIDEAMAQAGLDRSVLPIVVTPTGMLRNANLATFAEHIGLLYQPTSLHVHDVVVVGAGPAGLAAAVYGASEGLDTLVIDAQSVGGQAGTSSRIENYVGFPTGISGGDLAERAALQAQRLGARLTVPARCVDIEVVCDGYRLTLEDESVVMTKTVMVAAGVQYRRLPIDRLEEFEGAGVFYAATELEARVCAGSPVTVVGGGNSAGQAAIFLAQQGSQVTIAIRGESLHKSMSAYLIERIEASPSISVANHTEVDGLGGETRLEEISLRDNRTGTVTTQPCRGLFLFIGAVPFTDWLGDVVELDAKGFIVTDNAVTASADHVPLPFETSQPGIFAAGDVRSGSMKRVASSVGEGSSAIRSIHEHLAPLQAAAS